MSQRRGAARPPARRGRRGPFPRHAKKPSLGLDGAHPCAPTVAGTALDVRASPAPCQTHCPRARSAARAASATIFDGASGPRFESTGLPSSACADAVGWHGAAGRWTRGLVPETVGAQGCAPSSPRDGVWRVSGASPRGRRPAAAGREVILKRGAYRRRRLATTEVEVTSGRRRRELRRCARPSAADSGDRSGHPRRSGSALRSSERHRSAGARAPPPFVARARARR